MGKVDGKWTLIEEKQLPAIPLDQRRYVRAKRPSSSSSSEGSQLDNQLTAYDDNNNSYDHADPSPTSSPTATPTLLVEETLPVVETLRTVRGTKNSNNNNKNKKKKQPFKRDPICTRSTSTATIPTTATNSNKEKLLLETGRLFIKYPLTARTTPTATPTGNNNGNSYRSHLRSASKKNNNSES